MKAKTSHAWDGYFDRSKKHLANAQIDTTELDKLLAGFTDRLENFYGDGYVQEERGYTLEDWNEVVDNLVEIGLPQALGKSLKLSARAKGGSNKALFKTEVRGSMRIMHYLKVQILPAAEGRIDALLAVYRLDARVAEDTDAKTTTSMKDENDFRRYVELQAAQNWKEKALNFQDST